MVGSQAVVETPYMTLRNLTVRELGWDSGPCKAVFVDVCNSTVQGHALFASDFNGTS